jgi:hypothetical protein
MVSPGAQTLHFPVKEVYFSRGQQKFALYKGRKAEQKEQTAR